MNIAEKIVRIRRDFDDVYEQGRKKEFTDFWNEFQDWGCRRSYYCSFSGKGWDDVTYNPTYPIITGKYANDAKQMFYYSDIISTKVDIVINIDQGTSDYLFGYCKKLVDIPMLDITNYTGKYTGWFSNCDSLENIRIAGTLKNSGLDFHWSTKLSADSLENIINALSTEVTGLTITLPSVAVSTYDTANGPGNWQNLIETRANWTIAYA